MFYCQPESFYNELNLISNHYKMFKSLSLAQASIPNGVKAIEPLSYIINMYLTESKNTEMNDRDIFSIRTFGIYNKLIPSEDDSQMNVFYASVHSGCLWISLPERSNISVQNDEIIFKNKDEFGDEYEFTFEEILNEINNPMALESYNMFDINVFHPANLMAKIPIKLLPNLV